MTKYTIELEDEMARALVHDLREDGSPAEDELADQIERQIPIVHLPVFAGAVVESVEGQVFQRWTTDDRSDTPWRLLHSESLVGHLSTDALGRVTKVWFIGVETV